MEEKASSAGSVTGLPTLSLQIRHLVRFFQNPAPLRPSTLRAAGADCCSGCSSLSKGTPMRHRLRFWICLCFLRTTLPSLVPASAYGQSPPSPPATSVSPSVQGASTAPITRQWYGAPILAADLVASVGGTALALGTKSTGPLLPAFAGFAINAVGNRRGWSIGG